MFKHILIATCAIILIISLFATTQNSSNNVPVVNYSEYNKSAQLENVTENTSTEHIIKEGVTTLNKSVDNLTTEKADVLIWDQQQGYNDGLHNVDASEYIDMHKNILKRVKSEYDRQYIEAQIDSYTTGWFEGNEAYLANNTKT